MEYQERTYIATELVEAARTADIDRSDNSLDESAKHWLIIDGNRKWNSLELRDLWAHRDLFYLLAWRDIKVRYQQTVLGATWAILQPLLSTAVFTLLFGKLARMPSDGEPYAIFAYAALLPWNFFNNAVANSSNSLVGNANLITKVYFPRLVIPGAAVAAALMDFAIAAVMLFIMMPFFGVAFSFRLLMFPVLVILTAVVALGIGFWTSALNVKYRDVRYALPFALQLWMYLTPIIYPASIVPLRWRWILELNPLTGIIEGFRDATFGRPFDCRAIGLSAAIGVLLLLWSGSVFRRMEHEFADVI
jgi:lipopolysaccharide transport system permease protein